MTANLAIWTLIMMSLKIEKGVLVPKESITPLDLWNGVVMEPQSTTARIHQYSYRVLPGLPPGEISAD